MIHSRIIRRFRELCFQALRNQQKQEAFFRELSAHVRFRRIAKCWTLDELAARTKIARTTLHSLESGDGRRKWTMKFAQQVLYVLR